MKKCFCCKETKHTSDFKRDKSRKDNLYSYCKLCNAVKATAYRLKNEERIRQYNRDYHKRNTESHKRRQQLFRKNSTEKYLVGLARRRARRKGIEFSLLPKDISIPKLCPVLGIELGIQRGVRGPSSPSIDRVDNTKGYTPNNIIIISTRANELKRDASLKEIQQLASFYKRYGK